MKKKISTITKFNKEIYALRFALTTKCNLNCTYCFVKKDKKVFCLKEAKKILNIFLNSPGKTKLLMIYGGEPLLFFSLLKEIIIFSRQEARRNKKNLIISIGTNGLLLNEEILDFFERKNIKLSVTLDGRKSFNDKARLSVSKKSSFNGVIKKIPLLLKNTKKQNRCILFGILPSSVSNLFENFLFILSLGFDSVNIEAIQSPIFKWNDKQKKCFSVEMKKVVVYIYGNIKRGNFIFLNSINRELWNEGISGSYKKAICPFYQNLEVYPDGEMTFSPFLMNSSDRKKYIIGTTDKGFLNKYEMCKYDHLSAVCKKCFGDYCNTNNQVKILAGDIVKIRNVYSIYMAMKIMEIAKKEEVFSEYIDEAKERIFE